jgi:hypothetical protein
MDLECNWKIKGFYQVLLIIWNVINSSDDGNIWIGLGWVDMGSHSISSYQNIFCFAFNKM